MTNPTDSRVAQALHLFSQVGSLLARAEHVVRNAEAASIPRLDLVLRSLMQCSHHLAQGWNAALASVQIPEEKPEAPPVAPAAPEPHAPEPHAPPQQPSAWANPVHPLAQRMLESQ